MTTDTAPPADDLIDRLREAVDSIDSLTAALETALAISAEKTGKALLAMNERAESAERELAQARELLRGYQRTGADIQASLDQKLAARLTPYCDDSAEAKR